MKSTIAFFVLLNSISCANENKERIPEYSQLQIDPRAQINFLEKYTNENQDDDEMAYKLAKLYFTNGNIDSALIYVNKAYLIDKNNNQYLFFQAQCFAVKGLFLDSKDAFEKVIENGIPHNDYISLAADIYFSTNNFTKALNYLDRATAENPDSPFLFYKKGVIYESKGDTINAIKNYNKSIELNPSFIDAYIKWADLETKRGNFSTVRKYLINALRFDSLNSNLYFHLALAYKKLELKDSSSLFYEKAIQFDSNYTDALYNISIIYLQQGKYARAEQYLKKIAYLRPETPNINFKIAYALDFLNKETEALNYYQKIDSSDINYNFAQRLITRLKVKTTKTAVVEQEILK
ncbi:MAG: tetratricopeptide repeat protein [Cytophagales bacterium]